MKKIINTWGCLLFGAIFFVVLVVVWKLNTSVAPAREPWLSCRMSNDANRFKIILPFIASRLLHNSDIVVIGDSRTYADIDPNIFNRITGIKLFNYSAGQGDGGQLLYMLKRLEKIPPKKLIVVLSPLSMRSTFEQIHDNLCSESEWTTFRKIFDQTLDHNLHILRSYLIATISMHGESKGLFIGNREGYFVCPFSGFGPRIDDSVKQNGSDNEYRRLLDKYNNDIKKRIPELEKEIITMKNIGWKIICIRIPISQSLLKIENSYFEGDIFGLLCKKTGVDYLDYSTADFIAHDGSHLSMKEAGKFSSRLAKDLIDHQFISDENSEVLSPK